VPEGPIRIEVRVAGATQRFWWGTEGGEMAPLGPELDASLISDEGGRGEHGSFTGAFVGMVAFDLRGLGWTAEFTSFDYRPG
jgi:xylan 1,4-beta-xylosidase